MPEEIYTCTKCKKDFVKYDDKQFYTDKARKFKGQPTLAVCNNCIKEKHDLDRKSTRQENRQTV